MTPKQIDMCAVAKAVFDREEIQFKDSLQVTKDVVIHRFNDDELHILVDAVGGFTAVEYPSEGAHRVIQQGHLSQYEQACDLSTCTDCGDRVSSVIGCPDGAELCQRCFDAGAH